MKKLLALLMAVVMVLCFAACGNNEDDKKDNDSADNGEEIEEVENKFDENSGEKLIEEYRALSEEYVAAYKEDPYSDKLTELDRKINEKASEISSYKAYLIGELGDEADAEIEAIEEEIRQIATDRSKTLFGD